MGSALPNRWPRTGDPSSGEGAVRRSGVHRTVTETDEDEAVDALKELGLATYEARVFMALIRLGRGTASEVANVSEVPRSQVYTTAHDLEERGLISRQRSNPQVFRPVSLEEAEAQLERRFEHQRNTAFEHLHRLERQSNPSSEQSEEVWSITGTDAITERIVQLIEEAEERVLYGSAVLETVNIDLLKAVSSCCDRAVDVVLIRESDQTLPAEWAEIPCTVDYQLPPEWQGNDYAERVLVVDSDVFLFSIQSGAGANDTDEVAIWSAHTTFATAFAQLIVGGFPNSFLEDIDSTP